MKKIILAMCLCFSLFAKEYKPRILIFETDEEMGNACAKMLYETIAQQKETVIGLATGSTPISTYKALLNLLKKNPMDLSRLTTFNLDEYLELPLDHSESYHSFMYEHLFNDLLQLPVNFASGNIHIPNGYAKEEIDLTEDEQKILRAKFPKQNAILSQEEMHWILERRAEEYENAIADKGPIEVQILGIGTNGHIGFAEPGFSFSSPTSLVKLTENTRKDNARFFRDRKLAPKEAITMGIATILKAKKIYLLACGAHKAEIMRKVIEEPISTNIPATALRTHPDVIIFLDREAAKYLKQKKHSL